MKQELKGKEKVYFIVVQVITIGGWIGLVAGVILAAIF